MNNLIRSFRNQKSTRRGTIAVIPLVLFALATGLTAFGQQESDSIFGRQAMVDALPLISADAIFGFEDTSAWQISTNSAATTSVTLTNIRTQGTWAYGVSSPANFTALNSQSVSSTAPALAGIGVQGAKFAVDIRFPASKNQGSLRLMLNSPSRGLKAVSLGSVSFGTLRAGTYQTITFPITDQVRKALAGAKYSDLTFELDLSTPQGAGVYQFDNLRIKSLMPVTVDQTTVVPNGFGGSVDFDVPQPVGPVAPADFIAGVDPAYVQERTFDVGPVQIPAAFHVKTGTTSSALQIQLDLGYSSTSIVATCLYQPDLKDTSLKSLVFASCTGGPLPGDIISASWARLTVINGVAPLRIKAQLARRPVGDQAGSGIIPPMPTFWGDEDTCIPAPGGTITSVSQSCSNTVSQSSKIITDYFNSVTKANPSLGWVVAPVPEFAKRHGDASPVNNGARTAHVNTANATGKLLSINESGHANPGGTFDAYWQLLGQANYTMFDGTDRTLAHMDADFSTHGVLLGEDITVLDASAFADADSGQTIGGTLPSSNHAEAHLYLFGLEYPVGGLSSDPDGNFNKSISLFSPPPLDAPPIHFWIFAVKVGVTASAGLDISGTVSPLILSLSATPQGSIGAHLWGGIDVVVASGGLDVNVDLLRVKIPVAAKVNWALDPRPDKCAAFVGASVDSDLTLSSGGGHVDLEATFGICPFCDDESVTLFSWDPLFQKTVAVFHDSANLDPLPLPPAFCTANAPSVSVSSPSSDTGAIFGTVSYSLVGKATENNVGSSQFGQDLVCDGTTIIFTWSVDNPADKIVGSGCSPQIIFANTNHTAQITLKAQHAVTDLFGRTLYETGTSLPKSVNVTKLTEGVHITKITDLTTAVDQGPPVSGKWVFSVPSAPSPNGYVLTGSLVTPTGVDPSIYVRYEWKVKHVLRDGTVINQDITCHLTSAPQYCVADFNQIQNAGNIDLKTYWDPEYDADQTGTYTVTFSAYSTATGELLGSDSFDAIFFNIG